MQIRTRDVWKSDFVGPTFHFPLRFRHSVWYKTLSNSGIGHQIFKSFWNMINTLESLSVFFSEPLNHAFHHSMDKFYFWRLRKGHSEFLSLLVKKKKVKQSKQETKRKHWSSNNMVDKLIKFNDKYYAWRRSSMSYWKILLSEDTIGCHIVSVAWQQTFCFMIMETVDVSVRTSSCQVGNDIQENRANVCWELPLCYVP